MVGNTVVDQWLAGFLSRAITQWTTIEFHCGFCYCPSAWDSWADDVDSNKFRESILINKRPSFVGLQFKWGPTLSEDDCLAIYLNLHLITEYLGFWQPPDRGAEDSSSVRHHCLFV